MKKDSGCVYLVGAGPGDPELLTVKALRLIQGADTVVYDNLVGRDILALIPASTRRIYVGKVSGNHSVPQQEINRMLVELGQDGGQIIRLKGGDPYIFGRGGEEISALVEAGRRFEVVPGITAASGMAAYAGMPLTHRDLAQSCVFVTGHLKDNRLDLDWPALARPHQTLVFYMGITSLPEICRELIAHGLAPHTPAAIVRNATLTDQLTLTSTLDALPDRCQAAGVKPPALLIVGEVVTLAATHDWHQQGHTSITAPALVEAC